MSGLRVIAGKVGGTKLASPKGTAARPSGGKLKEALFSIISAHIDSARVLDLFAGSGALGIEALSRGAASCDFVDNNRYSLDVVRQNIDKTHFSENSRVISAHYLAFLRRVDTAQPYDLVFLDPPYYMGYIDKALEIIKAQGLLSPDGIIVCETASDETFSVCDGFSVLKQSRYGNSSLIILESVYK